MPRDTESECNESDQKRSKLSSKKKKHEKRKHKHKKHRKEKHNKHKRRHSSTSSREASPERIKKKKLKKLSTADDADAQIGPIIPSNLEQAKPTMVPLTKEQWEKQQSVTRRVYDEETGRHRLIKGDGEVVEEIVSKKRHLDINRQATTGDGNYFQNQLGLKQDSK